MVTLGDNIHDAFQKIDKKKINDTAEELKPKIRNGWNIFKSKFDEIVDSVNNQRRPEPTPPVYPLNNGQFYPPPDHLQQFQVPPPQSYPQQQQNFNSNPPQFYPQQQQQPKTSDNYEIEN